jgi:group I intron endonuclease
MENIGIYEIRCLISGKSYVGSSKSIRSRWSQHRNALRRGNHTSPRLQQAWNKHGERQFVFKILEECAPDVLFEREQFWIDSKRRDYNSMPKVRIFTKEMVAKRLAKLRLLAEQRTHCPQGHEYTPENVYYGRSGKGDKRCKACNRERIASLRAAELPERRASRLKKLREYHMKNREAHNARMREYGRIYRKS